MKVCPQCDQTYVDDSLSYCLLDGKPLLSTESQPTIVMPSSAVPVTTVITPVPQKTSSSKVWIVLLVIVILFALGGFAGILIYLSMSRQNTNVNLALNANIPSTPKPTATPKVSPSVISTPGTIVADIRPSPTEEDVKEATPIAWNTAASTFKTDVGRTYKFECPPNGSESAIWGSDVYAADSSICTAAVHAGIITLADGGNVTIEFRPGRSVYGSTVRNGITSNTYGEYPHSFVVR